MAGSDLVVEKFGGTVQPGTKLQLGQIEPIDRLRFGTWQVISRKCIYMGRWLHGFTSSQSAGAAQERLTQSALSH